MMKSESRNLMSTLLLRNSSTLGQALSAFTCFAWLTASAADLAGWQQRQGLEMKAPGLVRVSLPAETLGASQPRLGDVRLLSPNAQEVPYTLEWPVLASVSTQPVASFRATLNASSTVLDIATGSAAPIVSVRLGCASPIFIKAATLEGSDDGANWQPVVANSVLFREASGIEQLEITVPSRVWKQLRVTLDDAKSPPVAFTSASVRQHGDATATQDFTASIAAREELKGQTRLTLHFGHANPFLGELRLSVGDALFHRQVQLLTPKASEGLASGMVYRTVVDGHEAAQLMLPVHRQVEGAEALLVIDNGDSPPLRIESIAATRYPVALVFQAEAAGSYTLYTGQAQALAPSYDIAALAGQLRTATASAAVLGPLVANPSYSATATLPQTGEPGAATELAEWSRRRLVQHGAAGVLRVVLDAEVLAHAQLGLHDVRLLQDGHQLPYIIEAIADSLELPMTLTLENDAKQPRLSRWHLGNPSPGLPIQSLQFEAATDLFERSVSLWHSATDRHGNAYRETLASGRWTRTPGQASAFSINLSARVPDDAWFLETDNGDNAALQLTAAKLRYATHAVLCRVTGNTPLHLYYGNARAPQPRYDIRLIEPELRAALKTSATLSEVELLKPEAPKPSTPGAGSPWLWAALAAVVAGLLFAVAKLLPKA